MPDERLPIRTLVELADTLVDSFELVDLLSLLISRCVEAIDVSAAGLMLGTPQGDLRVVASSSGVTRLVQLLEIDAAESPCAECFRTGSPVFAESLASTGSRWEAFSVMARGAGFNAVYVLPMRLRGLVIGVLNLFRTKAGPLSEADILAAQALVDISTIAILQHRAGQQAQIVNEQLHYALNSRIAIEQAKGIICERAGIDMDAAFALLRSEARSHNRRLVDVAQSVIDGAPIPQSSIDPTRIPRLRSSAPPGGNADSNSSDRSS